MNFIELTWFCFGKPLLMRSSLWSKTAFVFPVVWFSSSRERLSVVTLHVNIHDCREKAALKWSFGAHNPFRALQGPDYCRTWFFKPLKMDDGPGEKWNVKLKSFCYCESAWPWQQKRVGGSWDAVLRFVYSILIYSSENGFSGFCCCHLNAETLCCKKVHHHIFFTWYNIPDKRYLSLKKYQNMTTHDPLEGLFIFNCGECYKMKTGSSYKDAQKLLKN